MSLLDLNDIRRDALELLQTDVSVHILDVGLEDVPTLDDIHLIGEEADEGDECWIGYFKVDTNLERLYEVSYRYETEMFYITTYTMTFCKKYDPPHLY